MDIQSKVFNWTGSIVSVIAAIILALNISISALAFPIYILGNILWILGSLKEKNIPIILQSSIFVLINILAIFRWF
jgi:hypothetical protein